MSRRGGAVNRAGRILRVVVSPRLTSAEGVAVQEFKGKVVVVTGAAGGIGRGLVERFARGGIGRGRREARGRRLAR